MKFHGTILLLSPQGDPQDDPRYFPLPKERKRSFESSDEGLSSDDDLFNRKVQSTISKDSSRDKGSRRARQSRSEKKRKRDAKENHSDSKKETNNSAPPLPRRETSRRAAKEKINMKQLIARQGDDDLEEPPEFMDSDSDPAWTPQAKNDGEEEPLDKRRKRGRPGGKSCVCVLLVLIILLYFKCCFILSWLQEETVKKPNNSCCAECRDS